MFFDVPDLLTLRKLLIPVSVLMSNKKHISALSLKKNGTEASLINSMQKHSCCLLIPFFIA